MMMLKGGSKMVVGTGMRCCPKYRSSSAPLPSGEVGAKRRVRGYALSINRNPSPQPSPNGRGSALLLLLRLYATSDSQPLNLVRPLGEGDVLGFHVEVERIIAAVAADP